MRARVAWRIYGRTGHGEWLTEAQAVSFVKSLNEEYGGGTHWVEYQ